MGDLGDPRARACMHRVSDCRKGEIVDLGARATSESLVSETLWNSVSSWRAARRAGRLGVPVTQIYRDTDSSTSRERTSAREHGSGFGRGPADGLVHKTRANARIGTARQPLQTPPPPADGAALRRSPARDVHQMLSVHGKAARLTPGSPSSQQKPPRRQERPSTECSSQTTAGRRRLRPPCAACAPGSELANRRTGHWTIGRFAAAGPAREQPEETPRLQNQPRQTAAVQPAAAASSSRAAAAGSSSSQCSSSQQSRTGSRRRTSTRSAQRSRSTTTDSSSSSKPAAAASSSSQQQQTAAADSTAAASSQHTRSAGERA